MVHTDFTCTTYGLFDGNVELVQSSSHRGQIEAHVDILSASYVARLAFPVLGGARARHGSKDLQSLVRLYNIELR